MISTADVLEVDSCGTPAGVSISHLILRKRRNEVLEKSVARVYVLDRALASKGPRAGACTPIRVRQKPSIPSSRKSFLIGRRNAYAAQINQRPGLLG